MSLKGWKQFFFLLLLDFCGLIPIICIVILVSGALVSENTKLVLSSVLLLLLFLPLTCLFAPHRKMQISGATTDLASKGQCISDCSNVKVKGEIDDPFHSDMKVRCLCGSSLETESMIKVRINILFYFF